MVRTAIITGAGSGIGLATAKALSTMGFAVVGVGRDKAKLAVLESAIGYAGMVATISADVTAADAPERIVALALERFGRIDALVNNAGVQVRFQASMFWFASLTSPRVRSTCTTASRTSRTSSWLTPSP